ncbi:hypothetical protein POF50_004440 [Streptomyces sp. SL13]|uniref:Uncharacterized protein n=1 Tax=Streptantibioticus silvisoli TaxID=2705255 RepID=A0AA90GY82_9ACTN|nr:hypothetical protein [Streptantibioticus silvisoli]MDI5968601.1 hypothetical protein [Streptantibioticus silvisoli]
MSRTAAMVAGQYVRYSPSGMADVAAGMPCRVCIAVSFSATSARVSP